MKRVIGSGGGAAAGAVAADSDGLAVGEASMSRWSLNTNGVFTGSGALRLGFFTARKSETITQVRVWSGSTAAGATPTLVRIGLWTVAANGTITLVAGTPNDTTLFAAVNTAYTKALSAAYAKVAGQRYAVGVLIVTGAATPTLLGQSFALPAEWSALPAIAGVAGGQADLPASLSPGSGYGDNSHIPYVALLP